jgi:hypothetical protein
MGEGYPGIPDTAIPETWEPRGRSKDRLFDAGGATVVGRTVLYAHADIEAALVTTGWGELLAPTGDGGGKDDPGDRLVGIDTVAPFAFATALSFRPPLAPGIGPAALLPMVLTEARRSFGSDLRNRGFETVDRNSRDRIHTAGGDRARLAKYTATFPLGADAPADALHVEGWLAVWIHANSFRVAGGAYPTAGLDALLADHEDPPATDPSEFRNDLINLVRRVE